MEDDFRAGVTAVLRTWSVLATAVQNQWGGTQSLSKAQDLRTNVLEFFAKAPEVHDLEDALAIYMEEEFSLTLEDGSEQQIARILFDLYQQYCNNDNTLARTLVQQSLQAQQQQQQQAMSVLQRPEHDDDDDEDDDDMDTTPISTPLTAPCSSMAEYAAQPLFGTLQKNTQQPKATPPPRQLGQTPPAMPDASTEIMDDNGFSTVVKRKGRSKAV